MDFSEQQLKFLNEMKNGILQAVADEGRNTRDYVDQKIDAAEQRIIQSVGEMLEANVLPQIDDREKRLTKLEAKTT